MNPDPKKKKPIGRWAAREPRKLDPSEKEFWELDDDESGPPGRKDARAGGQPPETPEESASGPSPDPSAAPPASSGEEAVPSPASEAEQPSASPPHDSPPAPGPRRVSLKKPQADPPASPAPETPEPAATSEKPPPPSPGPISQPRPRRPRLSTGERVSLVAVVAAVLAIGGWMVSLFFANIETRNPQEGVTFPVKGKEIVITHAETYWRQPDPEHDRGVTRDTRLIPAAIIRIAPESGDASLRCFFEDDSGHFVGDPATLTIENGAFRSNNDHRIEVHATGGFNNVGDHAAYIAREIETWYFVAKEGPSARALGREFEELFRIPISTQRR